MFGVKAFGELRLIRSLRGLESQGLGFRVQGVANGHFDGASASSKSPGSIAPHARESLQYKYRRVLCWQCTTIKQQVLCGGSTHLFLLSRRRMLNFCQGSKKPGIQLADSRGFYLEGQGDSVNK